jgi:hypothetical protein
LTKREITYRAENFVMKKKILSGIFALALLITAGYGVSKSMNDNANADLSLLALSNVEALAQDETGEDDCISRQSIVGQSIVCPGMGYTIWVTVYDFECFGSGGTCNGMAGFVGSTCSGYPYPPLTEQTKRCGS